jgi:hypothetical protein
VTYLKVLSRYWRRDTDENCRKLDGSRSKCCVRDSIRVPRRYKSGALPLCKFNIVNNDCHQ